MQTEQSLIIIKPDAIQRNLVGEIIGRFERKGLKIIGMKMTHLTDVLLEEHYSHIADKPFFPRIRKFMKSAPVIIMALSGAQAVAAIRTIVGPTKAFEAAAGTVRGDLAMSMQSNVVHASDSVENGEIEIKRFFTKDEILDYEKLGETVVYSDLFE
ncbi:MAG TPA: nucleoside-diphosphate kinase [Candidatus Paceibacterota bacterium]|jgi:nucleoside-diphosphate kinase|nr:nucleoside-diphosphate kinase [Candidatus Paceibacterota bacterium]